MKKEELDIQVKTYSDLFYEVQNKLEKVGNLNKPMKVLKLSDEDVKTDFMEDNERFHKFCNSVACSITKADATPMSYAAVVSKVAERFDISYDKMLSVSIIEGSDFGNELTDIFNQDKSADNPHPLPLTSMYIKVNDKVYEYFEGSYEGIAHLDEVALADRVS